MEFIVRIEKYHQCKYVDHTGAFTKGGAKPCCNHPKTIESKGYNCFKRIIPYKMKYWDLYKKDFAEAKEIPIWCPLRTLKKY